MRHIHGKHGILAVAIALLVGACVAEDPWTRERQAEVTRLDLPVAPAVALRAAERAVGEIAPRTTNFDYANNGFVADRSIAEFMIIAAMTGTYSYAVTVAPSPGAGSVMEIKLFSDTNAITAAGTSPGSRSLWQSAQAYDLLKDRIRYHAGLKANWVSCATARSTYGGGTFEPICLGATATGPSD